MAERYAIYFAPAPGTALAAFGARWLGRDPHARAAVSRFALEDVAPAAWEAAVALPRRYGFHATLKPPFRLAAGETEEGLCAALTEFCRERAPAPLGALRQGVLDGFLVLLADHTGPVTALAAACIREFDGFSAPPDAGEIERRRAAGLSEAQEALLVRWGSPRVFEEFRFHMTLTDALPAAEQARFRAELDRLLVPFGAAAATVDALTLFAEPAPGADFVVLERFPFGRAA